MGGRAGRSKGCLTCKKRHLKCDEARPTCLRCRQTGHYCRGYASQAFINENARFEPSSSPADLPVSPKSVVDDVVLHGSPSLSPMLDDICITHLQRSLFVTDPLDNLPPWLGFRALEVKTLNLSLRCLHSLARAHFGQVQRVETVRRDGSQLYVESLGLLNQRLASPAPTADDDTLMAVWIMTAYELLVLSTSTGWTSHALGLGKLIELRGPAAFMHGLAHDIFENTRFLIILASLAVAKRTFLAQTMWKTVPWGLTMDDGGHDPVYMEQCRHSGKSPMHYLLDVIAELPGLREDFNGNEGASDSSILAARVSAVYGELRNWRREWEQTPEGFITTTATATVTATWAPSGESAFASLLHDLPPSPWQPSLRFTSLMAANTACNYDAALILTIELMSQLSVRRERPSGRSAGCSPAPPPPKFPLPNPHTHSWSDLSFIQTQLEQQQKEEANAAAAAAAVEICRSVAFQISSGTASRSRPSSSSAMSGQFLVLWPLRMAWKALGGSDTVEGRWVERVLAAFEASGPSWGVQRQVMGGT